MRAEGYNPLIGRQNPLSQYLSFTQLATYRPDRIIRLSRGRRTFNAPPPGVSRRGMASPKDRQRFHPEPC
jgi:hypothetical protein